ncbi:MAG: hypothetical protein ACMG57_04450 [Candidatus Dojkabacteria bacterium]
MNMQNAEPDTTEDLVSEGILTQVKTKEIDPKVLLDIIARIEETLKLYYSPRTDRRGLVKTSMERGSFVSDKHDITDANITTIILGLWIPSVFVSKEIFIKMTAKKGTEPSYKIKISKQTVVFTRSELGRLIVDQLLVAFPGITINIPEA